LAGVGVLAASFALAQSPWPRPTATPSCSRAVPSPRPSISTPALPNLPTIAEAGVPGYEAGSWLSILAPAGTPRPIIGRLNEAIEKIVAEPEIRERLIKAGSEPVTRSPEAFAKRMIAAGEEFGRVAKALEIKPQ
jgi:tripartite-type tricarboxylate transporter receptor subunit TctC